jgi:2-C-methyl-D-erythritol 4-phosphate cytidylyltransferase
MSLHEFLGRVSIIVPAAGKGMRMGGAVAKQYQPLNGQPVLQHTLERMISLGAREVVLVVAADDCHHVAVPGVRQCTVVRGGETRAQSVKNALDHLQAGAEDWVLVHDGVRPCVRREDILRLIDRVGEHVVGGILAVPVVDTVKQLGDDERTITLSRSGLWLAQTPQLFRYPVLQRALEQAMRYDRRVTDESSAVEAMGQNPLLVEGHRDNIKITADGDLALAAFYLQQQAVS